MSTVQDYSEGLINRATAKHLVAVLGMRAIDLAEHVAAAPDTAAPLVQGRPEILGQVDWAVTVELARTVTDVMMRRTQLPVLLGYGPRPGRGAGGGLSYG